MRIYDPDVVLSRGPRYADAINDMVAPDIYWRRKYIDVGVGCQRFA